LADVDPPTILRVAGSNECGGVGNFPVGDGAEDRDEVNGPSFDGEPVEPDGRARPGATGLVTLALASSTAF
jgi:hypothetical protein